MKNAYITGYRSYELGILSDQDQRIEGLSRFLRKRELELLDEGYDWFIFSGQLGIEYYAFVEAIALKDEGYDLSLAVMLPYTNFGEQWSEKNQWKLNEYKEKADFVGFTSNEPYQTPQQLKQHTQFLLYATTGAVVLYDDEVTSKVKFFVNDAQYYKQSHDYELKLYSLFDLQESVYEDQMGEDIFCE